MDETKVGTDYAKSSLGSTSNQENQDCEDNYVYDITEIQDLVKGDELPAQYLNEMNEKENDEPGAGVSPVILMELEGHEGQQVEGHEGQLMEDHEGQQVEIHDEQGIMEHEYGEESDSESDGQFECNEENARIVKFMEDFDKRYKDDLLNDATQHDQEDEKMDQDRDQDQGSSHQSYFTGNAEEQNEYKDDYDDMPLSERISKMRKEKRNRQKYEDEEDIPLAQRIAKIKNKRRKDRHLPLKKRKYTRKYLPPPIERPSRANAGKHTVYNEFVHGIEQLTRELKKRAKARALASQDLEESSQSLQQQDGDDDTMNDSMGPDEDEHIDQDQDQEPSEGSEVNTAEEVEDEDDIPLSKRLSRMKKKKRKQRYLSERNAKPIEEAEEVQLSACGRPLRAKAGKNAAFNEFVHGIEQLIRKKRTRTEIPPSGEEEGSNNEREGDDDDEEEEEIEAPRSPRPVRSTAGITKAFSDFVEKPVPVEKPRAYHRPGPPRTGKRPSLPAMIMELFIRRRRVVSLQRIFSFLVDKYKVNLVRTGYLVKRFLLQAVKAGILFQTNAIGARGSYRLCTRNPPKYIPPGVSRKKYLNPKDLQKPSITPVIRERKKIGRPRKIRPPREKKKIGRPPGAKNKFPRKRKLPNQTESEIGIETAQGGQGPVEAIPIPVPLPETIPLTVETVQKGRGRPAGSKNKPKPLRDPANRAKAPRPKSKPKAKILLPKNLEIIETTEVEVLPNEFIELIELGSPPPGDEDPSNPNQAKAPRPKPKPKAKAKILLPKNSIATEVQVVPDEFVELIQFGSPPVVQPNPPSPVAGPSGTYDPYSKYQGMTEQEQIDMILYESRIEEVTLSDSD